MPSQPFDFVGSAGRTLSGQLDLPSGPVRGYAIFAHCFTCSKRSLAAVRIGRALAAEGIAQLRFDFTGIGESEGEFGAGGLSSDIADLIAAAAAMEAGGMAPDLLVGHSLGGGAVLAAAAAIPSVKAVATINAPFEVEHVTHHFSDALPRLLQEGEAVITLGGRSFRMNRAFIEDLARHNEAETIRHLGRPLLILHAPKDEVVGIDAASAIFMAARHPKSFVSLDQADHFLSDRRDADFAAGLIAAWASRYLPGEPVATEHAGPPVAELTGEGKFQTRITVKGGTIIADEPLEVGGLDSGPTPYELVGAGLAACTAMTLNLYAERKGWTLPAFEVAVAHQSRPGEEPMDLFTRRIAFRETLSADQQERLLEIADRCPVHRTLERGAAVRTISGADAMAADPAAQHLEDMTAACDALDSEG